MTPVSSTKTYTLQPSWKQFFWAYLLSVLTIPIGIGMIALYFIRRKHKSIQYIISDRSIKTVDAKYEHRVDLVDIKKISVQTNWLAQQLHIGTLILQTSASDMVLRGLEHAEQLKKLLEQAIEAEVNQQKETQRTAPHQPKYEAGSMEKINYLTGLWQQGLISEEDYKKERKHFE